MGKLIPHKPHQLKQRQRQQQQQQSSKLVVTLISLLLLSDLTNYPLGCAGWSPDYIIDIFLPLCQLAETQELIWFTSEQMDANNSLRVQQFIVEMHGKLGITQMVLTNRTDLRIVRTESKKNYMGLVFTTGPRDPIMLVHDRVLLGRHFGMNVIVPVQQIDDFNVVVQFNVDMQRRNFQNTFVYIQSSNGTNALWGYVMYPQFAVMNQTDLYAYLMERYRSIRSASLDAFGFEFKTPLRLDMPYVFLNRKAARFHGTSYKMIELFIGYINATLMNYAMPLDSDGGHVMDMSAALNLVRTNEVPFLAHAYALFASDDELDKSYPLMVVKWCLMVPVWNSVSTYFYPIKPFDVVVWLLFLFTFFALLGTELLLALGPAALTTKARRRRRRLQFAQLFEQLILRDFCFVVNISTGSRLHTPKSLVRAFLLLCIFFFGFFLSANYGALLGSILTVNLFRQNINSMEDLIRSNVSVMIIDYELDFLLGGNNDLNVEFLKLLHAVDVATFYRHQSSLNTSFAYFVTDDKWHFMRLQQKYLKQGIFKFTDICFGSHLLAYPLRPDSAIWRNLEYYIYSMHSSGMLQYFESTAFDNAVHAGLMTQLTEANEYTSAGLEHLFMVFMLLLLGSGVSFLIFLAECSWFRFFSGLKLKKRKL